MPFMKSLPEDVTLLNIFRKHPESSKPLCEFTEIVMRGPSPFSVAEREMIAAFTSGINACQYCYNTHKVTAEAFDIDADLLESLLEDVETSEIDDKLKPVLNYIKKLTLTPAKMIQADADAIFESGWNEDAFHHLVTVCALFNFYNRILEGHGIKGTSEYHKQGGNRLAEKGYGGIMEMLENTPPEFSLNHFQTLLQTVTQVIDDDPLNQALEDKLNEKFHSDSDIFKAIVAACQAGIESGALCQNEAGNIKYGRVIKPCPELAGFSVDVVLMKDVKGPHHRHPQGEINIIMPITDNAKFDGRGAGWLVYVPDSSHSPTVSDGDAIVLYLIPNGEIEFTRHK